MTDTPIREALARLWLTNRYSDPDAWDRCPPTMHQFAFSFADAALSILSTALAERDARIADLEPRAFLVRYPDGTEKVLDAKKWDPRRSAFWINTEAQAQHEIVPLFLKPNSRSHSND
tara:strand:- start:3123 stop:3476 length:354 start_codon:yes stop_codon:yes gene_type:complete